MKDVFLALVRAVTKVLGVLAVVCVLYGAWAFWSIHKVKAFCGDVKPGIEVTSLPGIAARHGIEKHWLNGKGVFSASDNNWFVPVPAEAAMGDVSCDIRHDGKQVLSAQMQSD